MRRDGIFRRIQFRTYCHATEDEAKVRKAMNFLCPGSPIRETKVEGHYGNPLLILEASMKKSPQIKDFWKRVKASGYLPQIANEVARRLDEESNLHLRFDKQKAYLGDIAIVAHDDVVIAKAKVLAYPARKDRAVKAVLDYFQKMR